VQTALLGSSDIEVTKLCLGTWNMAKGGGWGPDDDEKAIALIRHALDTGCTFLDTARGYGGGHAERLVGQAVAGRREEVVIATKAVQCPPEQLGNEIEASLDGLQTDYVDLYICHWPRPSLPLEPFLAEMVRQRELGKIRAIGASNFNLEQMSIASEFGVVSLQPPLSILWRIPDPILDFCRQQNIALTSYSSLAQGLLTGRYTQGTGEISGVRSKNALFSDDIMPQALKVAERVDSIADRLGCASSQVALAWLLRTSGVSSVIVGASRPEQWDENLGAFDVSLSDQDYEELDRAGREVWGKVAPDAAMWGWKPE
jgi:myo-inositol catabolism protein IolS